MPKWWKIRKFAPRVTKAELHFFFSEKGLSSTGIPFTTQRYLKGESGKTYLVDGLIAPMCMVIEIDGASHDDPKQQVKDRRRDKDLIAAGYKTVLRFRNWEVYKKLGDCVQTVKRFYENHCKPTKDI